ncbi:MAG: T9SS type A sorting domain-containing protein, partial [Ignavibacteria bacterium]|nr:T9SS type A sorting domain-containing protein [Ignavibacteria bacterium]
FNGGVYDTSTITKVGNNELWINIDLLVDSLGSQVAGGPHLWTDMVMLNFSTNNIVTVPVVYWNIWSEYWQVYDSDNISSWGTGNFDNISNPTNVEENELEYTIDTYRLSQNYPNPFNPSTTIRYEVPTDTYVSLIVYDMLGNEVERLVDSEKPTGVYEVKFEIENLATGIYIYRINTGEFSESKKMVFLK